MMAAKEIYLIRHGETEFNRMGIVQGSGIDAPLNEHGLAQAAAFYRNYQHLPLDKIYVSKLKRSYQTVALFEANGIPLEKHEGLNEICWGAYEKKKLDSFDRSYYHGLVESWKSGDTSRPIEGGESPLDVAIRQQPVMDLIFSRKEEKTILICMHGRAMRILLCKLLNIPLSQMETFHHHNLGLYHLVVYANGEVEFKKENCTAHLFPRA